LIILCTIQTVVFRIEGLSAINFQG